MNSIDSNVANKPRASFRLIAMVYTVSYFIAVVLDHLTTIAALSNGAVETNVLFQSVGQGLAQSRAI